MKVKVIRTSDDYVLNVRYTDELLEAGEFKNEAEVEEAERNLNRRGIHYMPFGEIYLRKA